VYLENEVIQRFTDLCILAVKGVWEVVRHSILFRIIFKLFWSGGVAKKKGKGGKHILARGREGFGRGKVRGERLISGGRHCLLGVAKLLDEVVDEKGVVQIAGYAARS